MKPIPYKYHPTTITVVDDDKDLLNSITLALVDKFKCECFTSASEAKKFLLKNHKQQKLAESSPLNAYYGNVSSDLSVDVNISHIYQDIFNQKRFQQSCIAILDYDMPKTNGLDLATALKAEMPVKVIMLTGAADQGTAINAFNHQKIDRFILKSTPDYTEKLLQYIAELQLDCFLETSKAVLDSLNSNGNFPLQNKGFIDIFHQTCQENEIVEYYLLEESGSLLLLNAAGKATWLIARNEEDMQMFYELARDEYAPENTLKALKDREKIAFFLNRDGYIPPFEDWKFEKAIPLKKEGIYYCVLKGKDGYDLDVDKIYSYQKFLDAN